MKKLPKLYKNETHHFINHNCKTYHIKEEQTEEENTLSYQEILDQIFNGLGHPYNQKVFIKTKDKTYETYLVSKTKQNLLTLDNEVIPIEDILYIQKIKN